MRSMFFPLAVGLCLAAPGVRADSIHVRVNDQPVYFQGVGPREMNGHVLVPLRGVLEQMGAEVRWNAAAQTVVASRGDTRLRLPVGSRRAWVNGSPVRLDAPAMVIAGTTMVPLRFVSEALGADVTWDDRDRTVYIATSGVRGAGFEGRQPGRAHRAPGGFAGQGGSRAPAVFSVATDLVGNRIADGQTVHVTMRATPGGQGFFRIRYLFGERKMTETAPGLYEGSWTNTQGRELTVNPRDILAYVLVGDRATAEITPGGSTRR